MAYQIKKSELYYRDYQSTAANDDDPAIRDKRDSSKFDRNEWFEVVDLINHISREENFQTLLQCRLIEVLIREKLPIEFAYNRVDAIKWLVDNQDKYRLIGNAAKP